MNIKKKIRREFISLSMVLVMVLTFFYSTNAEAETITSNDWIDGFDYDLLFDYKAVVGLAVGNDLSMEGSSYGGRVTMTNITGDTIQRTPGNGISIRATGAYGIGYSIKESAQRNGMLLDMQGVISCTARKSQPSINNCPAYGEYAAVAVTLDLNSFSVSIPAGISFSAATSSTPCSHQDNLDIR